MREELEITIASLDKERLSSIDKFNDRLRRNPIAFQAYSKKIQNLLCLSEMMGPYAAPYASAHVFYDTYGGLFEFAKNLKDEHPKYEETELKGFLEKFCMEDEKISDYMINHLHTPTEESIASFAHDVVEMYNSLELLGFCEIIEKEKLIQEKYEELASLTQNRNNNNMQQTFGGEDGPLEKIGDITRGLVNKGAKKLIKIASFVATKTDEKKNN